MIVKSAKYMKDAEGNSDCINAVIDDKQTFVPVAEGNLHYQAILKWVEEGNTIEAAD
jgi:hypothetical protein|tara:strand:- start:40 stop:210 length:171 start_codon:yes stop_codon:yes gene_type:complete